MADETPTTSDEPGDVTTTPAPVESVQTDTLPTVVPDAAPAPKVDLTPSVDPAGSGAALPEGPTTAELQAQIDAFKALQGVKDEAVAALEAKVEAQRRAALSAKLADMGVHENARELAPQDIDLSTDKGRIALADWAEKHPYLLADRTPRTPEVDYVAQHKAMNSPHLVDPVDIHRKKMRTVRGGRR